jgi:SOS-response transcriptional repressor LexA
MKNSDRLKTVRETLNINQNEFARTLGFAPSFISDIERDKKELSRELLQKLLEKYQININWLLSGTGEMFLANMGKESSNPPQIPKLTFMIDQRLVKIEAQIGEIRNCLNETSKNTSEFGLFTKDPEPDYEIRENIDYVDNVVAGRPIYASDDPSTILVPKRFIKTKPEDYYAGRIKGTSMIAAGIPDGVRVLIRKSDVPIDGAIQVVEHQGEITIKRVRELPGGGWKLCFEDYSGGYIEIGPGDEFHIQGDFVMVIPEEDD